MTSSASAPNKSIIEKLVVYGFTIRSTDWGYKIFHNCNESNQQSTAMLSLIGASCVACGNSQGMEISAGFLSMYPGFTSVDHAVQRREGRRRYPCRVIRGEFETRVRGESNHQRKADDERDCPGV